MGNRFRLPTKKKKINLLSVALRVVVELWRCLPSGGASADLCCDAETMPVEGDLLRVLPRVLLRDDHHASTTLLCH